MWLFNIIENGKGYQGFWNNFNEKFLKSKGIYQQMETEQHTDV